MCQNKYIKVRPICDGQNKFSLNGASCCNSDLFDRMGLLPPFLSHQKQDGSVFWGTAWRTPQNGSERCDTEGYLIETERFSLTCVEDLPSTDNSFIKAENIKLPLWLYVMSYKCPASFLWRLYELIHVKR